MVEAMIERHADDRYVLIVHLGEVRQAKPSRLMHLPEDDLQNILLTSARHLDRNIQMLERGGQGPDHPVHPAIVETRYIKSITCRLLPNS